MFPNFKCCLDGALLSLLPKENVISAENLRVALNISADFKIFFTPESTEIPHE